MTVPLPPVYIDQCPIDYGMYVVLVIWAVALALLIGICLGRRLR